MSSTITEVDEELKDNNIKSSNRQCHNCKEQFRISKVVSSKSFNPLNEICQKYYENCNKEILQKKNKDLAYDRMKEELFLYLKNNIPLQSIELDQIQYYDFVKSKKHEFIMTFNFDNKIKKVHIIND